MPLYIETGKFNIQAELFRRSASSVTEQYTGAPRVSLGKIYLAAADIDFFQFDIDSPTDDGDKQFIIKKHPAFRSGNISELEIDLPDSEPEPGLAGTYKVFRAGAIKKTNGFYILLDLRR